MIPFSFFYFFFSITLLAVGSYTDFKERIISNKLTYSAVAIGILIHLIESYYSADYSVLGITVIVTIATFIASYGLWKIGVWAGGDVKLFTALAALNPVNLGIIRDAIGLKYSLLASISLPVFPLTLFIFSIFSMLPYGVFLSLGTLKKRKDLRDKLIFELKEKLIYTAETIALITGISFILGKFTEGILLFILVIAVIIISTKLEHKLKLILTLILFGFALYSDFKFVFQNYLIGFISLYFIYVFLKMFSFGREYSLKKKIKVKELEEGMIPAFSLYEIEGKIIEKKPLSIGNIIKHVRTNNLQALLGELQPKGKEIVSAKKAAGITDEKVLELKKLAEEKKINEEIEIKLTAPMIPAVFIGYVLVNITGDLIWNLM